MANISIDQSGEQGVPVKDSLVIPPRRLSNASRHRRVVRYLLGDWIETACSASLSLI